MGENPVQDTLGGHFGSRATISIGGNAGLPVERECKAADGGRWWLILASYCVLVTSACVVFCVVARAS